MLTNVAVVYSFSLMSSISFFIHTIFLIDFSHIYISSFF